MRPSSLLLPASLLLLACGASAQTTPYPQPDATPSSTVQVKAPAATAYVTPDQARHISGIYAMSNGWHLKVSGSSHHIDARIDNNKPMRLRAIADNKFVSRDGNVMMQFNQGEFEEDMTMSYVPEGRLAQVVVISSGLAQR